MIEIQTPDELIPPEIIAKLGRKQLNQLAKMLAGAARDEWIRLASQDNSSMRGDYIRGIQKPEVSEGTAVIALVGTVANLLEHGDGGVDLRDILLGDHIPTKPRGTRGGKHEASEGGYYRAIPFRHATPGASAQVVGAEMGSAHSRQSGTEFGKKLGREIYGEAKKLKSYSGGAAAAQRRLAPGHAPKLKDHHKTDIYAGMIREEKTYEQAAQSQYFTFRTISTHVTDAEGDRVEATEGWQRDAIVGRKFAEKVSDYVAKIAADAAKAMLEVE